MDKKQTSVTITPKALRILKRWKKQIKIINKTVTEIEENIWQQINNFVKNKEGKIDWDKYDVFFTL